MPQPPVKLPLNEGTIRRAVERNLKAEPKLFARKLGRFEIAVRCHNDEHPRGHVCHFEVTGTGDLWGWCVTPHDGGPCPAAINRNVCHHLSAALALYVAFRHQDADEEAREEDERRARRARVNAIVDGLSRSRGPNMMPV